MNINRKFLFITLITFILSINIFPDETTDTGTGLITGTLAVKFSKYWNFEFNYKGKLVTGSFDKRVPLDLPKDRYPVEVRIGEKMYKGSIFRNTPLFGKNIFEIDILCDTTKLEGTITPYYKKVYKDNKIECIYGNSFYEGNILYGRKNEEKTISLKYADNTINGFTAVRDKKSRIVDYKINDKKVFGTITPLSRTLQEYKVEAQGLTDDELFMFLFFEIFYIIEKKSLEDEAQKTKDNVKGGEFIEDKSYYHPEEDVDD